MRPSTDVIVGLPIPDDHFGTTLLVPAESFEDSTLTLAIFASKVEAIDSTVRDAMAAGDGPAAAVRIVLNPDGTVLLRWQHQETLDPVERRIG